MRKKLITEEKINELIKSYEIDLISSNELSIKFNIPKKRVLEILKEKNVPLRNSGRIYIGGVIESNKRYGSKPEIKERKKIIHKNWSEKNKEHLKEYHKKWREENLDKWRETKRNYEKTRKSTDPIYKLIGNFRTAIYTVLKENNVTKYGHYFEILGYQPEQLINHLEVQFKDGMSWDNYGEWHVDHKLPITHFNISEMGDSEFIKCWSLDNLQPMWGDENIKKSNKLLD
jgi:hypothetical protein